MGWCESPPFLYAVTETIRDIIQRMLNEDLPPHPLEGKMMPVMTLEEHAQHHANSVANAMASSTLTAKSGHPQASHSSKTSHTNLASEPTCAPTQTSQPECTLIEVYVDDFLSMVQSTDPIYLRKVITY